MSTLDGTLSPQNRTEAQARLARTLLPQHVGRYDFIGTEGRLVSVESPLMKPLYGRVENFSILLRYGGEDAREWVLVMDDETQTKFKWVLIKPLVKPSGGFGEDFSDDWSIVEFENVELGAIMAIELSMGRQDVPDPS